MGNVKLITTLAGGLQVAGGRVFVLVRNFLSGRFGRYVLRGDIRKAWRLIWGIIIACLIWTYVVCPFFAWWDKVVTLLNHVIWG